MLNKSLRVNTSLSTYYYVIEKDFHIVRRLTKKLDSEKFTCLGVSSNVNDFLELFTKSMVKPSLLFIGFQNITSNSLEQIDYLTNVYGIKVILFNDNITEYSGTFGIRYNVIEV